MHGLGMNLVAKSDLTTGNKKYASYAIMSNELTFVFSAPYSSHMIHEDSSSPHPSFSHNNVYKFIAEHGLAVRAVTIKVDDSELAYQTCMKNGAVGVLEPITMIDSKSLKSAVISEIKMFGDVVIRWMSGDFDGPALPNYETIQPSVNQSYGLQRIDHVVSNVPNLFEAVDYLMNAIGLHEFSEFTADDIGTVESGLNSMVLASNNEFVLLPVNEPTFGTKRKSQIQNYLEHNQGPGVQHIALKTTNIFHTVRAMRERSEFGGFGFMPAPSPEYYEKVPNRIGKDTLSAAELRELQELGILADKDDQGVLLQVFTLPVGDRPTLFLEIIQRIGCETDLHTGQPQPQSAGCGGFGKGNFSELFKSIEDFEKLQEGVLQPQAKKLKA
mmetsp:Transcript_27648/g.38090  ORF Transcript_27648/g.38090 Transcript_27648/m.38090 type:complete len:385 (+) Transcript_27648:221-1375(+)